MVEFRGLGCAVSLWGGRRWTGLTVPCGFDVSFDPLFDRSDVLLGVLEIFPNIDRLATRDEAVLGRVAGLGVDVLDTR